MGYGDALMVSAEVRNLYKQTGKFVAVGDGRSLKLGLPEREVLSSNPYIAKTLSGGVVWLKNFSGSRPYIDYERMYEEYSQSGKISANYKKDPTQPWRFTAWRARDVGPGEFWFSDLEKSDAKILTAPLGEFVVIEPSHKPGASPNKDWSAEKYSAIAEFLISKGLTVLQFTNSNISARLPGAKLMRVISYRMAASILSNAKLYIGSEGGLHHAAAAVGVPAVVYHGGYISPETTGYKGQIALYRENGSPCGARVPCRHCYDISKEISVDEAIAAITKMLKGEANG